MTSSHSSADTGHNSGLASAVRGALLGLLLGVVPVSASADVLEVIRAPVPRSGDVDVPLSMSGIRPLAPIRMAAKAGPRVFQTLHRGTFNRQAVRYQAILEETVIENPAGSAATSVFSTSYIAQRSDGSRPVLFVFNGGPGAASVFLHFTSLGPKRLTSLQAANFGNAANSLQDNPASVLDATDLVFVDAADTGFGHSYGVAAKDFRSLDADSEAMSQVVLNWLRTHGRMSAPTYLLGESYGSLRVIAMARDLARSEPKVRVDGLVLAGFAITFAQNGRVPNPLFVAARLPMMASVAWHYGKIDNVHQTWEQAVGKARNFVRDEYAGALMWGHRLDSRTWERIVGALPDIIGIPASYFKEHGTLAVDDFNSELLRDGGLILDRNDGLQALPPSRTPPPPEDDADLGKHFSAFQTNMESYARDELRAVGLGAYAPVRIPPKTEKSWDFETAGAPALDVTLATLLQDDPKMRVLVLQGRYDTLTDLGSTEYVLGQTNIAPDRYHIAYYDGGHMLRPEAEALDSLRAFMRSAAKPGDPKHAADN